MKLELRRDREANGDVFYAVYKNDTRLHGVYAGNDLKDQDFQNKDHIGEESGINLYNTILAKGLTGQQTTIIKSQEL